MLKLYKAYFNVAISAILVLALTTCAAAIPGFALASTPELKVKDAESVVRATSLSLDEAEKELNKISAECKALDKEVSDMQSKIDELADDVIEAQLKMVNGRESLSNAVRHEYKNSTSSMFLDLLLNASNFVQLSQNVLYVGQIMDATSDEIETQKRLKVEFEEAGKKLNVQKNEQESKLNALENKQAEAQGVVNRVSSELEENKDKLDALKKQAEEIKRQEAQVVKASKIPSEGTKPSNKNSSSNSSSNKTSSSSNSTSGESTNTSGREWREGSASAYGGSTDPNTPLGNPTANGSAVTENSMGVAIPMSWPNYKDYFGRRVEIVYGGKTVYATVNDCGGMKGGARVLDLQPGVFKAFGATSCYDWGVRTVKFRFL